MLTTSVGRMLSNLTTAILVACAVAVTGLLVKREFGSAPSSRVGVRFEAQSDWKSYAVAGHRIGPANATAVLVEFADFQCPACRALEHTL